jgi:hypothetical protein
MKKSLNPSKAQTRNSSTLSKLGKENEDNSLDAKDVKTLLEAISKVTGKN